MKKKPSYELYCDQDGVLTDFDGRFEHFAGLLPKAYEEKFGTKALWSLIDKKIGYTFWSEMGWTKEGKKLWSFIRDYDPILLTSPSRSESSRAGKKTWVEQNLSPMPKIFFRYSGEKHMVAHPRAIHIDDREDIIERWRERGGIGILCPKNGNVDGVIKELKNLGYV